MGREPHGGARVGGLPMRGERRCWWTEEGGCDG